MDSDRHLELDIRDPAWTAAPGDIVAGVLADTPQTVTVLGAEAGAPSALVAQLLVVLRRHVEAAGGSFAVSAPTSDFVEGLALLGLSDAILGPEGVQ